MPRTPMKHSSRGSTSQHALNDEIVIGVVGYSGGVRHLVAGCSRAEVYGQLARYVLAAADAQLYPADAEAVRRLVATGRGEDAVNHYFEAVGSRWDREWLEIRPARIDGPGNDSVEQGGDRLCLHGG